MLKSSDDQWGVMKRLSLLAVLRYWVWRLHAADD